MPRGARPYRHVGQTLHALHLLIVVGEEVRLVDELLEVVQVRAGVVTGHHAVSLGVGVLGATEPQAGLFVLGLTGCGIARTQAVTQGAAMSRGGFRLGVGEVLAERGVPGRRGGLGEPVACGAAREEGVEVGEAHAACWRRSWGRGRRAIKERASQAS